MARSTPFKSQAARTYLRRHNPRKYARIKRQHGEKIGGGKLRRKR